MSGARDARPALAVPALCTALVAVAAGAAALSSHALHPVHPLGLLALTALLVLAGHLVIRFRYRDQVDALDLVESVLAPLLLTQGTLWVVGAVVVAKGLTCLHHRVPAVKAAFNVCQWTAAAAVGSLVVQAVAGAPRAGVTGGRELLAVALALTVVIALNRLAVLAVISLAQHAPVVARPRELARLVVSEWSLPWVVGVTFGLLFAATYATAGWTAALLAVPLVVLHRAGRAEASWSADEARMRGLREASLALATAVEPWATLPALLARVQASFACRAAQYLPDPDGRPDPRGASPAAVWGVEGGWSGAAQEALDAAVLAHRGSRRVEAGVGDGAVAAALAPAGWRDCVLTDVVVAGERVGVLVTYDRAGLEGFESGELAVLEALATELAGTFEREALLAALRGERARLAEIIDGSSDGVATFDVTGCVTTWNPAMTRITGLSHEEADAGLTRLEPCDEAGEPLGIDHWTGRREMPATVTITRADGSRRWLSCSYGRVDGAAGGPNGASHLVVMVRDVTAMHELDRLRDDFVAVVSHELRTPLAPIKGWATTLLTRGDRMTDAQRRDAVLAISRQADRLEHLVLNILEVSRIENAPASTRDTVSHVGALVERVVDGVVDNHPERDVRLHDEAGPVAVRGQAVWLDRIISNLLTNAVKYAPGDAPVDVWVEADAGRVTVAVADRGPGIPTGYEEQVFGRFERLPAAATQTGTGLGLYLSRQLAHAMGGSLRVGPRPGGGAVFVLTLARADAPGPVAAPGVGDGPRLPATRTGEVAAVQAPPAPLPAVGAGA